jgi:hypothetical protein
VANFLNEYRSYFSQEGIDIYSGDFHNYCFMRLQKLPQERLLAFFLDQHDKLISDEIRAPLKDLEE